MDVTIPHIMIDIETWGPNPGSSLLSIAAVQFFPHHIGYEIGDSFEVAIDPKEGGRYGLTIDPGTVCWWMQQSDAARRAAFDPFDPQALTIALLKLKSWIEEREQGGSAALIWGHGASFDPVLVSEACRAAHVPVPWQFRNIRDTRTIFGLVEDFNVKLYRAPGEIEHIAINDAVAQARAVCAAYRLLGFRNAHGRPDGALPQKPA